VTFTTEGQAAHTSYYFRVAEKEGWDFSIVFTEEQ